MGSRINVPQCWEQVCAQASDTAGLSKWDEQTALVQSQYPCPDGLYCKYYDEDGCKKILASVWAYSRHLCIKHGFGCDTTQRFAKAQFVQLKDYGFSVEDQGQGHQKKLRAEESEPASSRSSGTSRDLRRFSI